MTRRTWVAGPLLAAVLLFGVAACTSPEAQRSRSAGPGADIGNRGDVPQPAVAPSPPPSIPVTSTPLPKPSGSPSPSPAASPAVGQPVILTPSPSPSPPPGAPALPTVRPGG